MRSGEGARNCEEIHTSGPGLELDDQATLLRHPPCLEIPGFLLTRPLDIECPEDLNHEFSHHHHCERTAAAAALASAKLEPRVTRQFPH